MRRDLLIVVSAVLVLIRAAGEKGEIFQAAAHLWVGGLCGAYAVGRRRLLPALVALMSVAEVLCFLASRGTP